MHRDDGNVLLPDRVPRRVHDASLVPRRDQLAVRAHFHPAGIHPHLGRVSQETGQPCHPHGQVQSRAAHTPSQSLINVIHHRKNSFRCCWIYRWRRRQHSYYLIQKRKTKQKTRMVRLERVLCSSRF